MQLASMVRHFASHGRVTAGLVRGHQGVWFTFVLLWHINPGRQQIQMAGTAGIFASTRTPGSGTGWECGAGGKGEKRERGDAMWLELYVLELQSSVAVERKREADAPGRKLA